MTTKYERNGKCGVSSTPLSKHRDEHCFINPLRILSSSAESSKYSFKMVSGGCACRHIRYTTSIAPSRLVNCHCLECRKQAGAPYTAWVFFPQDTITWEVNPTEWRSSDFASRFFCPRCGSTIMMFLDKDLPSVGIAAGTLDDDTQVPPPTSHIFLEEKASWFDIPDDGAERYQEWSD